MKKIFLDVKGENKGHYAPVKIVLPCPGLHFGCLVEIEAIAEVNEL